MQCLRTFRKMAPWTPGTGMLFRNLKVYFVNNPTNVRQFLQTVVPSFKMPETFLTNSQLRPIVCFQKEVNFKPKMASLIKKIN